MSRPGDMMTQDDIENKPETTQHSGLANFWRSTLAHSGDQSREIETDDVFKPDSGIPDKSSITSASMHQFYDDILDVEDDDDDILLLSAQWPSPFDKLMQFRRSTLWLGLLSGLTGLTLILWLKVSMMQGEGYTWCLTCPSSMICARAPVIPSFQLCKPDYPYEQLSLNGVEEDFIWPGKNSWIYAKSTKKMLDHLWHFFQTTETAGLIELYPGEDAYANPVLSLYTGICNRPATIFVNASDTVQQLVYMLGTNGLVRQVRIIHDTALNNCEKTTQKKGTTCISKFYNQLSVHALFPVSALALHIRKETACLINGLLEPITLHTDVRLAFLLSGDLAGASAANACLRQIQRQFSERKIPVYSP